MPIVKVTQPDGSVTEEDIDLPIPASPVQTEVHAAYFRAALASIGKLDQVDTAVNQDPVKAQLWGWATTISILNPDVINIAQALNIDLAAVLAKALEIKAGTNNGEG